MQIEYIECLAFDNRLLSNGRGQDHVTRFVKFCLYHIFGISEARRFKFRVLIDTRVLRKKNQIEAAMLCQPF